MVFVVLFRSRICPRSIGSNGTWEQRIIKELNFNMRRLKRDVSRKKSKLPPAPWQEFIEY